jgi:hypothetical protein
MKTTAITIRVPGSVAAALKKDATKNYRSLAAHLRAILTEVALKKIGGIK